MNHHQKIKNALNDLFVKSEHQAGLEYALELLGPEPKPHLEPLHGYYYWVRRKVWEISKCNKGKFGSPKEFIFTDGSSMRCHAFSKDDWDPIPIKEREG